MIIISSINCVQHLQQGKPAHERGCRECSIRKHLTFEGYPRLLGPASQSPFVPELLSGPASDVKIGDDTDGSRCFELRGASSTIPSIAQHELSIDCKHHFWSDQSFTAHMLHSFAYCTCDLVQTLKAPFASVHTQMHSMHCFSQHRGSPATKVRPLCVLSWRMVCCIINRPLQRSSPEQGYVSLSRLLLVIIHTHA